MRRLNPELARLPARSHGVRWLAVLLLWLLFAQTAFESRLTSLTTDEPLHLISGYSYLKTGDARLVEEHPPLIKVIFSSPLMLSEELGDPRAARGWPEGSLITVMRAILLGYPSLERVAFLVRVPVMGLALILAALVYRWATDWNGRGRTAGLVALALCALDPNMVAHAQLATTDIGVTLFLFAAWYALWRWAGKPSRARWAGVGILLGLALASKMSSLIAVPVMALVVCVLSAKRQRKAWRGALGLAVRVLAALAALFALAAFVVWAVYAFELRWLPGWPVPIPAASHLIPLARLFEHQRAGHNTFLWGQNSQMGWWYYFPVALAVKTPLPTLILLAAALAGLGISALRLWKRRAWAELTKLGKQTLVLAAFPVVFFAVALFSTVDIGYRHLLPVLPFLFVLIPQGLNLFELGSESAGWARRARLAAGVLLGVWYVISVARALPWPLTFFNELAGGPSNGYRFLVDSNLDWGQSFKALKAYLDRRGVGRVKLSTMAMLDPLVYGLDYEQLPPTRKGGQQFPARFDPLPGVYVISATSLQGVNTPDVDTFAHFRTITPTARIGHALFVYDVPDQPPGRWVAQCANPTPPLEADEIQAGLGRGDLRLVQFDCSKSWWYPASDAPGWYISGPGRELAPETLYAQVRLTYPLRLDRAGMVNVYRVDSARLPQDRQAQATSAPGDWPPARALAQGAQVTAPAPTTGPLQFEGFWLYPNRQSEQPGGEALVFTAWRVAHGADAPLSIMAHLLDAQGRVVSGADGLGVPIETWQAGDVIVQAHWLNVPRDVAPGTYWIETGLYRLDTLERYRILQRGQSVGDRLLLTAIEVAP